MSFMLPGLGGGLLTGLRGPSVNAVHFDGTNDYLTRGADLTSIANSKSFTFSCWVNIAAADGTQLHLINNATPVGGGTHRFFFVRASADNSIQCVGRDTSAVEILKIATSANSAQAADGWLHVLCSVNLNDTGKRHLYLNDVSDLNVTTYTDAAIDFTLDDWGIGGRPNGLQIMNGDLAEVWLLIGTYIDFSIEANRRKFITSTRKPADLGVGGTGPTGGAPDIYLSGATASWETNKGSGGGFTEHGALSAASTSPSD